MDINLDGFTNLVYSEYYKFLVSLGALTFIVSDFIQPLPFERVKLLEMSGIAIISGILGWFIDESWTHIEQNLTLKWKHNIAKTDFGKSPYENMDYDPMKLTAVMLGTRLAVILLFIGTEVWWYVSR